ncbi:MAG: hypothetical protein RLZZ579_895 [Actinomycetota bacterium]
MGSGFKSQGVHGKSSSYREGWIYFLTGVFGPEAVDHFFYTPKSGVISLGFIHLPGKLFALRVTKLGKNLNKFPCGQCRLEFWVQVDTSISRVQFESDLNDVSGFRIRGQALSTWENYPALSVDSYGSALVGVAIDGHFERCAFVGLKLL